MLDGDEVRDLLELFRSAIPQVRVPGMAPRLPPDSGVAAQGDAGTSDSGALSPDLR
jgi:hypothetical protein